MKSFRGFTLIEILIVLVIISIVAGVAVISITRNDHKQFEMMSERLVNLIHLAQDEAMLRPATLGLGITDDSFQFYIFQTDAKNWRPITYGPLARHRVPYGMRITVHFPDDDDRDKPNPQIIIPASGDIDPFTIEIGKTNQPPIYQVTTKGTGEITYELVSDS